MGRAALIGWAKSGCKRDCGLRKRGAGSGLGLGQGSGLKLMWVGVRAGLGCPGSLGGDSGGPQPHGQGVLGVIRLMWGTQDHDEGCSKGP